MREKMHTAREQIQIAISDETGGIFGIFLPNRKCLDIFTYEKVLWVKVQSNGERYKHTRMPCRSILNCLKLDTEKILIDVQDGRDNSRHREILLDSHIIQGESFLDVFAVIVSIIPNVKLAIKGKTFFFMLLFLEGKQNFAILDANWI